MFSVPSVFEPLSTYISNDPLLALSQGGFILVGALLVFLLFFTLRDILLRTHSFWYQFASVLLVGALPIVGFLLYLLIRPARTVKERQAARMLQSILDAVAPTESEETDDSTDSTPTEL